MLGFVLLSEHIMFLVGTMLFIISVPPMAICASASAYWEILDRGFRGGIFGKGHLRTGVLLGYVFPWLNSLTHKWHKKLVKKEEDAYVVNFAILSGIGTPLMLAACAWMYLNGKLDSPTTFFGAWLLYHVLRIGPYYSTYAYVYTLCHKEGHAIAARTGIFAPPYDKTGPFRFWFNWWVGLFYGVCPASFAVGHSINHHRYNNGPEDVVSTSDKPRDSFINLIAYIPRWFLYAVNVSTTLQFIAEGKMVVAQGIVFGTLVYFAFVGVFAFLLGSYFTAAFLVYPFLESGIFLACTNWSWHAYIDPNDVTNEYVQSITIVNGEMNILNEDSHVVHHQYPGVHWTDHPKLLEKHGASYGDNSPGSVFFHTHAFELFFLAATANYEALADRFIGDVKDPKTGKFLTLGFSDSQEKPKGSLPREEVIQLLKDRLQICWWGPRAKAGVEAGRILAKDLGIAKGTVQSDGHVEASPPQDSGSSTRKRATPSSKNTTMGTLVPGMVG